MTALELRKVGRPLIFDTGEALDKAVRLALKNLVEANMPLIVENVALELDCSPSTLRKYGERVEDRPEFLQPIKRMLDVCQAYQVSKLFNGTGNVAGVIFALKNNYPDEYRDKVESEQTIIADVTSNGETVGQFDPVIAAKFAENLKEQTKDE